MTDKITLKGMSFYGYHGVLPEEKTLGQRFLVDVTVHLDLYAAGQRDSIRESIDYTKLYGLVKEIVEGEKFNLIEALAERIAGTVLASFKSVQQVEVTVTKPEVPIAGILAGVQVQIARRQLTRVYLGLGSNIEPKEEYIRQAVRMLNGHPRITVRQASSLYFTEPVGYKDQDWFLNAVVACDTDLSPVELLQETQRIEVLLQRERRIHWGPRTIDIDIILYGQERINLPELIVPHPRAFERSFVLVPLAELTGGEIYAGKTAKDFLAQLKEPSKVEYYGPLKY